MQARISPIRCPSLKQREALHRLVPEESAAPARGAGNQWDARRPQLQAPQLLAICGLTLETLAARVQRIRDIRQGCHDREEAWWNDGSSDDEAVAQHGPSIHRI